MWECGNLGRCSGHCDRCSSGENHEGARAAEDRLWTVLGEECCPYRVGDSSDPGGPSQVHSWYAIHINTVYLIQYSLLDMHCNIETKWYTNNHSEILKMKMHRNHVICEMSINYYQIRFIILCCCLYLYMKWLTKIIICQKFIFYIFYTFYYK